MKSFREEFLSVCRPVVMVTLALTSATAALRPTHALAQACTFTTSPYTTKSAPIGLVAQGDTDWVENTKSDPKQNGLPLNDISVLTHYDKGTFKQIGIFIFWSDILSTANATPNFTSIDKALCDLQNYNISSGDNVKAKLRIVPDSRAPGDHGAVNTATPNYALAVGDPGGNGILIQEYAGGGRKLAVGGFWIPAYTNYWKALNDALAAKYDNYDIISEVSVNTCASVDLEPWEQPRDQTTGAIQSSLLTLSPAYTDKQILSCLSAGPDAYTSWVHTPIFDVFSGYACGGDGTATNCGTSLKSESVDTMQAMTNYLPLGAHLGYESNGLRPGSSTDGEQIFKSPDPTQPNGPPVQWQFYGRNASPVSMQPLDPNIGITDLKSAELFGFGECMTQLELNDGGQLGGGTQTQRLSKTDATYLANQFATRSPYNWTGTVRCKNLPGN